MFLQDKITTQLYEVNNIFYGDLDRLNINPMTIIDESTIKKNSYSSPFTGVNMMHYYKALIGI